MRVLAVTPMYPPDSRVGAWLATHACLAHLVRLGHHVDVVTLIGPRFEFELDGVQVHPRAQLSGFPRPDVVISHLGDDHVAANWANDQDIPSIRMVHGMNPDNQRFLDETPCALAVFNSKSLAETVRHDGIVVRPPFDPSSVRTTPGRKVTLVNMSAPKGGIVFWKLANTMPDVQFLAVRGGYGMQVSNKRKNVTQIDPTADMADDVYSQTRILLMPSERETWGMVGLEAMCSGIPVIAHPTPGLLESLGSAGVFVDRDDLAGWQQAIRSLLHPQTWAEQSRIAHQHASRYNPAPDLTRFAEAVTDVALVAA